MPKSDEGILQNRLADCKTRIFLLKSVTNEKLQLRLEKEKKDMKAFMCETGYQVNAYQVLYLIMRY